jgi:hypothetical protein
VSLFTSEAPTTPIVVGLDLSLTAAGYAGPDGTKVFASTGHKGDTLSRRASRLIDLACRIGDAVIAANPAGGPPDLVIIEGPAFSRVTGSMHDRSGLWWLVVAQLIETLSLDVIEVTPSALKKYITGKGNATKSDMRVAIFKRFGLDLADDNEADAFALRALGLDILSHPLAAMPAAHRAGLEKLPRPALADWFAELAQREGAA